MTKKIGLTGGIGSGKSTIAKHFESKGIPIYIADLEAKKIMEDSVVINEIKNVFGLDIFEKNQLVREKLAAIVFNNPEKLQALNAIIHPAVKKHFENWFLAQQQHSFIIYESAILFETGSYKDFDAIITVTAPIETRIKRVIQRDQTTKEQVLKRIEAQWTDQKKVEKSDYVIENTILELSLIKTDEILKILQNTQ
jgi:dephospho-CoA kinase